MSGRDEAATEARDEGTEILFFADEFGVLVQGPEDAVATTIDELLQGAEPGDGARRRLSAAEVAAVAATGMAAAASSGEYLRLTADGAAKVREFGAQFDGAGALRGWVKDGNQFAGQLTFEPVSMAAQQALAVQTAAVSLALKSAIADVQRAVEEVADKVDDLRKQMRARLQGDVVGTYRHLREVAEQTTRRGHLLEADWDSVAGVRNQLHRDLDTLRNYVRGEVNEVTLDLSVPDREKRFRRFVDEAGSVADALRLILVTEQSLQLFEYLRLQRIRDRDPAHVESALDDAKTSLRLQLDRDSELVALMLETIERARVIEALEVHRILSRSGLDAQARRFHDQVGSFSDSSRLTLPGDLGDMHQATIADARAEIRRRAVVASRRARELGTGAAKAGASGARLGGRRARDAFNRKRSGEE